jgi:hypothetical protein
VYVIVYSQPARITAVAERLGHASPNITLSIYSHALPADNEATAKLWNDAMQDVLRNSRLRLTDGGLSQVIRKPREKRVIPLKSVSLERETGLEPATSSLRN